jgi:hypothetical protein
MSSLPAENRLAKEFSMQPLLPGSLLLLAPLAAPTTFPRASSEEVRAGRGPRVLRRDGEDVAVVTPLPGPKKRRKGRTLSKEDYEAFRSAAGGWKDIDTDALIENIYESRRISTRPVDLLDSLVVDGLAISIVTFAEVLEGVYYGQNPSQYEAVFRRFLRIPA